MSLDRKAVLLGVLIITILEVSGCSKNSGPDPANANLAPVDQNASQTAPNDQTCANGGAGCTKPLTVAHQPPPPLPQYSQPQCPGENYIWTPGYWAYAEAGYYWVPGVWVLAPYVNALWTPPYWAFDGGSYHWHGGYWGPHIGYYGGINYGFGYAGLGYSGGYWNAGVFFYNRSASNVNVSIVRNVYSHSVTNYTPFNRVSYNGGPGGINRQASAPELAARRESRVAPLPAQVMQERTASVNRAQFATENHGRPTTAASQHPLQTSYRAPAAAPREWQRSEPTRGAPATEARPPAAQPAHGEMRRATPSGSADRRQIEPQRAASPVQQQRSPQARMTPQARPAAPESKPSPFPHGSAPQARPQSGPQQRPAPTPQAHPEGHPTPPQQHKDDRGRGGR